MNFQGKKTWLSNLLVNSNSQSAKVSKWTFLAEIYLKIQHFLTWKKWSWFVQLNKKMCFGSFLSSSHYINMFDHRKNHANYGNYIFFFIYAHSCTFLKQIMNENFFLYFKTDCAHSGENTGSIFYHHFLQI